MAYIHDLKVSAMNLTPKPLKNRLSPAAAQHLPPGLRKWAFRLAVVGACLLLLLTSLDALGQILAEGFHLLLEVAEEGLDTVLELTGLTPRMAQGVTAYIGFVAALAFCYRLYLKVQLWAAHIHERYCQIKTEIREQTSTVAASVRAGWKNQPWQKKALLGLSGLAILGGAVIAVVFFV